MAISYIKKLKEAHIKISKPRIYWTRIRDYWLTEGININLNSQKWIAGIKFVYWKGWKYWWWIDINCWEKKGKPRGDQIKSIL